MFKSFAMGHSFLVAGWAGDPPGRGVLNADSRLLTNNLPLHQSVVNCPNMVQFGIKRCRSQAAICGFGVDCRRIAMVVEMHNTGDPELRRDVTAMIEHVLADRPGDWRVSTMGCRRMIDGR